MAEYITNTDHGFADWTLVDGDIVAGVHKNIRKLILPPGSTVRVKPFDGVNYGSVEFDAYIVEIWGLLEARAAGYGSGAGGGGVSGQATASGYTVGAKGGTSTAGGGDGGRAGNGGDSYPPQYENGFPGNANSDGVPGGLGGSGGYSTGGGGGGGAGGGQFGGAGGNGGSIGIHPVEVGFPTFGKNGGYQGVGVNGDLTTGEEVYFGGGGGGGGGGSTPVGTWYDPVPGAGGGGAGTRGGGVVKIRASTILIAGSGQVSTKSWYAGDGGDGVVGGWPSHSYGGGGGGGGGDILGAGGDPGYIVSTLTGAGSYGIHGGPYGTWPTQTRLGFYGGDSPYYANCSGAWGGFGAGGGILMTFSPRWAMPTAYPKLRISGIVQSPGGSYVLFNGGTFKDLRFPNKSVAGSVYVGRQYSTRGLVAFLVC